MPPFQRFHLENYNIKAWSLSQTVESLATAVMQASDKYLAGGDGLNDIWDAPGFAEAYASYFFPLNALRMKAILAEAQNLSFLESNDTVIEFGSGPGVFQFAVYDHGLDFKRWHFIERSRCAIEWHKKWLNFQNRDMSRMNWSPQVVDIPESALGVFSYSLNEIKILPDWAYRCSKLLILEPSLQHTARPLQELRKPLLDSGFHLWAPCTHHEDCPLLLHSKSDWCHTRIHVDSPESVADLERHLPMKNRTLTYSYLLVAKHPRPEWSADKARVIGDTLYEKGKIRQFICRNSEREYLSWLKRHGEPEPLERGSLVELPPHRKMANELRVQAKD